MQGREHTVAAVVTFFRNQAHIQDAIASVLNQTRPPDEVVVVNDASPAGTTEVLATLPPPVRVVHHGTNRGVGGARQTGIEATSASCVAFLDGDDLWERTKLERMLHFWRDHPEADVLHSGTTTFDQHGRERRYLDKPSPLLLRDQLRWNRILMQTAMIPRLWLDRVGPFAARSDIVPDWDYGIRLVLAGARVECVPESLTRVRREQHGHISDGGLRQMRRRTATVRAHWPAALEAVGRAEACRNLVSIVREEAWKLPPLLGRPLIAGAWSVERILSGFISKR